MCGTWGEIWLPFCLSSARERLETALFISLICVCVCMVHAHANRQIYYKYEESNTKLHI